MTGVLKNSCMAIWICVILGIYGCVSIPEAHLTVGRRGQMDIVGLVGSCEHFPRAATAAEPAARGMALDARGFDLMNWNLFKGRRDGWSRDFSQIGENRDLFTLQEAYLTEDLREQLHQKDLNWDLVPAFEYHGIKAGVLTASKIAPEVLCTIRVEEPLIPIPKSILITRYPMTLPGSHLLVANVHSINFVLGTASFSRHWKQLEDILAPYEGPIILAGDFNTWSTERAAIVSKTTQRLGLEPVAFNPRERTTIFGKVVDHVYYRGLIPLEAVVHDVETSDHKPMVVTFKLADVQ